MAAVELSADDGLKHGIPLQNNRKTGLKGFEPLTCGLRVRRYAELSYRPKPVRPNNVVDNAE